MITTNRSYDFSAAHYLPQYEGKSRGMHGHNYRLEVGITGPVGPADSPERGMIQSFGSIDEWVTTSILARVDHTVLNYVLSALYPTTENFALWIFETLSVALARTTCELYKVRLCETPRGWVEVIA